MMTNKFNAELRHLAAEADRQGFDVRKTAAGGYLLLGPGWLVHSPDVAELWSALHRLSKTEKDRTKTDSDQPTLNNFF